MLHFIKAPNGETEFANYRIDWPEINVIKWTNKKPILIESLLAFTFPFTDKVSMHWVPVQVSAAAFSQVIVEIYFA